MYVHQYVYRYVHRHTHTHTSAVGQEYPGCTTEACGPLIGGLAIAAAGSAAKKCGACCGDGKG